MQALKISIGISFIGGLILVLWEILLIQVIYPDIINQINERIFKKTAKTGIDLTQEDIQRKIASIKKNNSPMVIIPKALIEHLFNDFLFGLIGGLIIRKKKTPLQ